MLGTRGLAAVGLRCCCVGWDFPKPCVYDICLLNTIIKLYRKALHVLCGCSNDSKIWPYHKQAKVIADLLNRIYVKHYVPLVSFSPKIFIHF